MILSHQLQGTTENNKGILKKAKYYTNYVRLKNHNLKKPQQAQKNPVFWPRPIVPLRCQSSIVSAAAFQDSVRDGKSWFHRALETRTQGFVLLL